MITLSINYGSYEILSFLENEVNKNEAFLINESARNGNIYLLKHYIQNSSLPKDILFKALESKNIELIQYVLDLEGRTALMCVSEEDQTEVAKLLLKHKDIDAKNNNGQTALMLASQNGSLEIVKSLLEFKSIDINTKNNNGQTPIMYACENGHIEIVKLLLEQEGIDFNAQNRGGEHYLCLHQIKIISILLNCFLSKKELISMPKIKMDIQHLCVHQLITKWKLLKSFLNKKELILKRRYIASSKPKVGSKKDRFRANVLQKVLSIKNNIGTYQKKFKNA